ncbi:MAG: ferredoxin [Nocardioides sp.]
MLASLRSDRGPQVLISVDRDRCEGLGMCEAMASDFFELDDDPPQTNARFAPLRPGTPERHEVMHVLDETPDESQRGHVNAAVQACPVLALTLRG